MLHLVTGSIQSGKTRWLEAELKGLRARGVTPCGVIAPGRWRDDGRGGLEKLGIDNVLLPQGEVVHLADRRDIALKAGTVEAGGQSERAGLGWAMSGEALERVDGHFAFLARDVAHEVGFKGALVVDELGRLELIHGQGIARALDLLLQGPQPAWEEAYVVVRSDLLPRAIGMLEGAWGGVHVLDPHDAGRE